MCRVDRIPVGWRDESGTKMATCKRKHVTHSDDTKGGGSCLASIPIPRATFSERKADGMLWQGKILSDKKVATGLPEGI